MLLGEGTHILRRPEEEARPLILDWASVSSPETSWVKVWCGDELVEDVHVGPYTPHTWWSSNALLGTREVPPGGTVTIEVGSAAVLRIETNLEPAV